MTTSIFINLIRNLISVSFPVQGEVFPHRRRERFLGQTQSAVLSLNPFFDCFRVGYVGRVWDGILDTAGCDNTAASIGFFPDNQRQLSDT